MDRAEQDLNQRGRMLQMYSKKIQFAYTYMFKISFNISVIFKDDTIDLNAACYNDKPWWFHDISMLLVLIWKAMTLR